VIRLAMMGWVLALATSSCAGAVESSKLEDNARRNVPVPICLKTLPRHGASGVVATLKPEDYWATLLPSYDSGAGTVDRDAPDCSGRQLLTSSELLQAEGSRTGPIKVGDGDVVVEGGPDGFKIVWLRTHKFADGTAAGLLGLVRAREAYAEVYAVGLHRGSAGRSRFAFERLGPEILVTATDDGCTGVKPNQSCETTLVSYLLSSGQLVAGARFALDRIQYGQAPGVGAVQYRLTATPVFQERSIRLVEQIVVRDATQTEIRKSDLERTFQLKDRGRLAASTESLWTQVVGGPSPPPSPQPAAPAAKTAPK
jgi:hypothetical protein